MPLKKPQITKDPLWTGPQCDGPQGGISQSLLGRFLCCRERFRLLVVEGLREEMLYNHKIEYGNMWQICEEYYAAQKPWKEPLLKYVRDSMVTHSNKADQIVKWYNICKIQFPIYIEHYNKQTESRIRKPVKQEHKFHVPYKLPSGRTVWLRGMMDEVFSKNKKLWLQENKARGDINEEAMKFELPFELQTMIYNKAMQIESSLGNLPAMPVAGVAYNVVRRPLSDWQGRFNIKQRKGRLNKKTGQRTGQESDQQYYERLGDLIKDNPSHFFMRWQSVITKGDSDRFVSEFLNPILEQLCDWWEHIQSNLDNPFENAGNSGVHYRMPYGVYNPLLLGRQTEYARFLHTGSELGMERVQTLFRELDTKEEVQ